MFPDAQSNGAGTNEIARSLLIHAAGSNQRQMWKRSLQGFDITRSSHLSAGENLDQIPSSPSGCSHFGGSQSAWDRQSITGCRELEEILVEPRAGQEHRAGFDDKDERFRNKGRFRRPPEGPGWYAAVPESLQKPRDRHSHFHDTNPAPEHCLCGKQRILRRAHANGRDDTDLLDARPNLLPGHRVKCTSYRGAIYLPSK